MKAIYKTCLWLLLTALLFTSCKKFLEQKSPDEIIPSSTDDLTQLLNAEAYPYSLTVDGYTDLLTDDVQCTGVPTGVAASLVPGYTTQLNNGTVLFTWNPGMFDSATTNVDVVSLSGVNSWKIYYSKIKGCNVVLDYVGKVAGDEKAKNALRGQALFLRAFYYLKLVTLYGQPYSGAGIEPTTSLGVPLVLTSEVSDEKPKRNTLAEVYSQIEKDLLSAAGLLKDNFVPGNTFRVGHLAAYMLLSRLYLYMGRDQDMDNVILYAGNLLAEKPGLTSLRSYMLTQLSAAYDQSGIYDFTKSPEVIWAFGTNSARTSTFFPEASAPGGAIPPYSVSPQLANLYDQGTDTSYKGDLRYLMYYARTTGIVWPVRSYKAFYSKSYDAKGIRVAEAYLNRAEALIRRYKKNGNAADLTQALSDLNTLRINRWDTRNKTYTPVNITDADALYQFCKDERRRELSFEENFRWVDIKRWGLAITHRYVDANGVATDYMLPAGSNLYALPIPYTAINRNERLTQNPR
jgi:starch-binding outer membrane protein, SusD/RagB family